MGAIVPFSFFFFFADFAQERLPLSYRHMSVRKSVQPIAIVEIIYYIITNMGPLLTIITFFKRTATLFFLFFYSFCLREKQKSKSKIRSCCLFLIRRSPGQGNEEEKSTKMNNLALLLYAILQRCNKSCMQMYYCIERG